jgi:hypothetical protein
MLQQRPNTFAQTILSLSFFACDEAADHTFRFARDSGAIAECQNWPSPGHPGLVWLFGALMPDQTILW